MVVCLSFLIRSPTRAGQRSPSVPLTTLQRESNRLFRAFNKYDESVSRFAYDTHVERLELLPDGTTQVHFKAERMSLMNANEGKESHETLILAWTDRERPPPFCKGLRVQVRTDTQGVIRIFYYGGEGSKFYAIRQRGNGEYEFILRVGNEHPGHPFIRLYPQKCDFGTPEVYWNDRFGMFMITFEAGGSEGEMEALRGGTAGVPIANEPGQRVSVGRDGWVDFEKWQASVGKHVTDDHSSPSTQLLQTAF